MARVSDEEEYEIIPTSPIRRLEKRLSRVESVSTGSEATKLIEQIIELIKSNQRIIDEVIKSDAELRNEVSKLPGRMDQLISKMDEFIDMLKASAEEAPGSPGAGIGAESAQTLIEKIGELVDQNKRNVETNQAILTSLDTIDKRLKRIYLQSSGRYSGEQGTG